MNYNIKLYFIIFFNFIYCFKNKIFSSISNKKQNDFEIINIYLEKMIIIFTRKEYFFQKIINIYTKVEDCIIKVL